SVELVDIEPVSFPPTSVQCALLATNATSSPSWKIGKTSPTSHKCEPPPSYGSLIKNTSPSLMSYPYVFKVSFTMKDNIPIKPVTPLPSVTSSPFLLVKPHASSNTSYIIGLIEFLAKAMNISSPVEIKES